MPLIWLTLFFTIVPYFFVQFAERYADEIEATFYGILEPLIGGVAAWTIGAESFTYVTVVGGILIVLALFVSEYHRPSIRTLKARTYSRSQSVKR
ncbi:MAG: hypothetical protein UY63_C0018G0032 [Parcubacteria group bacterium GW2011_GWA2_51_10]|nr:MAG: hypothetical protein UY63_C0018G0032 [Parcubacteria group bacterium GW2011_GWA2_51_10]